MADTNQLQWLQRLQSFLNKLLQPIIKDQSERNKYLMGSLTKDQTLRGYTKPPMAIWAQAFTHETFSPSDNYEDLEFLGDAMLKAVFPKYLMKRLPHLHKGEYTELNIHYMSKIKQAELCQKMGLGNFIRVTGIDRAILNLETDVFESFFGALDTVSDMVTPGIGFANCYNMIIEIFKDITIDESRSKGSPKTQVIQIFVRFDLPKPKERSPGTEVIIKGTPRLMSILNKDVRNPVLATASSTKDSDAYYDAYKQLISLLTDMNLITVEDEKISTQSKTTEFSVILGKPHIDFLAGYGININNPVIGHAYASTKKEAEFEAYKQALETLNKLGINNEWADDEKQRRDFSDPAIAPYIDAIGKRMAKEGFVSVYFFIPRKTVTLEGSIVQLVGVRQNGTSEVLSYTYATDRENGYSEGKLTVVKQYASGK